MGIPGGCEAAVHATRRFIYTISDGHVVAKLDFASIFNSLHRDVMLQALAYKVHEIYRFCYLSFHQFSILQFNSFQLLSNESPQQGDLLDLLLFCLSIQLLLNSTASDLTIGFTDCNGFLETDWFH